MDKFELAYCTLKCSHSQSHICIEYDLDISVWMCNLGSAVTFSNFDIKQSSFTNSKPIQLPSIPVVAESQNAERNLRVISAVICSGDLLRWGLRANTTPRDLLVPIPHTEQLISAKREKEWLANHAISTVYEPGLWLSTPTM